MVERTEPSERGPCVLLIPVPINDEIPISRILKSPITSYTHYQHEQKKLEDVVVVDESTIKSRGNPAVARPLPTNFQTLDPRRPKRSEGLGGSLCSGQLPPLVLRLYHYANGELSPRLTFIVMMVSVASPEGDEMQLSRDCLGSDE